MKISQNWLKEYVAFHLPPDKLAHGLTMTGLEVESFEDLARTFDRMVVGEVIRCSKHPNADRLSVCHVSDGKETYDVVCGAPNVAAGQKVPLALAGASIPHDQHDPEGNPFVLSRTTIRGVESNGMICSARELGLGEDADGILVLDPSARPGTPLAVHLKRNDVVFEVGVTPNRGDCLNHIGVAREVAVLAGTKVKLPAVRIRETRDPASRAVSIRIGDKRRCLRYSARVLRNVVVQPSPAWLRERLESVGVRPINVVVDVTNYVMLETGQPLHAFDLDLLAGPAIVVRTARPGETMTTLDGKQRDLNDDALLICDAERPVAIAGVMGGKNSEIHEATKRILIESATFLAANVRRTARFLGMSTEASYRFERGTDIEGTVRAADRAAQLIQQLTGAEVLRGVVDVHPRKRKTPPIILRPQRVNDILGTSLAKGTIAAHLKSLLFDVRPSPGNALKVTPPSFRSDIGQEIDLIEEVARVHGYDKIETKTRTAIDFSETVAADQFAEELRNALVGAGFNEILANSLQESRLAEAGGSPAVHVLNPVSAEMQALRTNLVAGAMPIIQHNRDHGNPNLRLFELGKVFSLTPGGDRNDLSPYGEDERLLMVLTGSAGPLSYGSDTRRVDLLDLKGEVDRLLRKFCLDKYRFIYYDTRSSLTEPGISVEINNTYAGYFGKVKRGFTDSFEIDDGVFVCELSVGVLATGWQKEKKYTPLPKFPTVTRDVAFVVDTALPQAELEEVLRESGRPLLTSVVLFDVYTGDQAGVGRKSLAYGLEFQAADHTLTDEEVDRVIRSMVEQAGRRCHAALRQ